MRVERIGVTEELLLALVRAGLPTDDLGEPGRMFFRFSDNGPTGFKGLEGTGPDRLLRSLVVLEDRRGSGVGGEIVEALEDEARRLGVVCLHLLTTTATGFFRGLGYMDVERGSAPLPIARSREFTALCPASASYLLKVL